MMNKIAHSAANAATELTADEAAPASRHTGTPLEVLLVFLKLGVSCFGGPIAHIGYFREEFVVRRRWLDEQAYVDLVALCQFLPGPASSQVGFSIGLMRAGYRGALAAWTLWESRFGCADGADQGHRRLPPDVPGGIPK